MKNKTGPAPLYEGGNVRALRLRDYAIGMAIVAVGAGAWSIPMGDNVLLSVAATMLGAGAGVAVLGLAVATFPGVGDEIIIAALTPCVCYILWYLAPTFGFAVVSLAVTGFVVRLFYDWRRKPRRTPPLPKPQWTVTKPLPELPPQSDRDVWIDE